mgnify:CR=1 FL=1
MQTGYIRYVDTKNKMTDAFVKRLPDATTIGNMLSFATLVRAHVNPGIAAYGLLRPEYVIPGTIDMASNGAMESVKDKGLLQFSYIDDNQQKSIMLWLPCPLINANWTHVEGVGYRLNKATGDDIAAALSTMTGIPGISFVRGIKEYRASRKASKAMYCIMFTDVKGAVCGMGVPKPTNVAALGVFMDFLRTDNLTNASITSGLFTNETSVILGPSAPLAVPLVETGWDSVDRRAKVAFRYVEAASAKTKMFNLAGVQEAACELISSDSNRHKLTKVVGDGLALGMTGVYGSSLTFSFKHGKVDEASLDPQ